MRPKGFKLSAKQIAAMVAGRRASLPSLETRFFAKVNKDAPGGCWQWISTAERKGYAVVWAWDKVRYAHRVSWVLAGRELADGMVLDHICRNTKCVNPDHLRMVTPKVNGTENNLSPIARNARKTHCPQGHEYSPANTAMVAVKVKTRHGHPSPTPRKQRFCLTCYPNYWRFAIVPRTPPANARPNHWKVRQRQQRMQAPK